MSKINFAIFVVGLTLGAAATWLCIRKRYEQIAQEEIDSVKSTFAERKSNASLYDLKTTENDTNKTKANQAKLKPDLIDYAIKLTDEGYTNYTVGHNKVMEKEMVDTIEKPYVISPDEFGEFEEYSQISLTYYSDGVLADDADDLMDDIADTVGSDFASHFGDYEEDSVFIRNDRFKCDYEILRDNRAYSAVTGINPDQMEE